MKLLLYGLIGYWLYENYFAGTAAATTLQTAAGPALNVLNAGPGISVSSITFAQLQNWVSSDVLAPDEADAILAAGQGLAADANALANGIAKVNAWLASGGS